MSTLDPSNVIELRNIAHELKTYKVGGDRELGRFQKGLALRILQSISGICKTCAGAGEIGCLRPDGYDCEPCPECAEASR
jgi:hypothetical protein